MATGADEPVEPEVDAIRTLLNESLAKHRSEMMAGIENLLGSHLSHLQAPLANSGGMEAEKSSSDEDRGYGPNVPDASKPEVSNGHGASFAPNGHGVSPTIEYYANSGGRETFTGIEHISVDNPILMNGEGHASGRRTSIDSEDAGKSVFTDDSDEGRRRMQDYSLHVQEVRRLERESSTQPVPGAHTPWIRRMVDSAYFEMIFTAAVLSNSVLIGAQVHYAALHKDTDEIPASFAILGYIYSFVFTLELFLRVGNDGCRHFFWASESLLWNYLDLVIVVASLFEVASEVWRIADSSQESISGVSANIRAIRFIRITRLARVLRVIKVIRFIRALRSLVQSIISTLKSLCWALVLLSLIIYVFAIMFTDAVTGYQVDARLAHRELDKELVASQARFGDLHTSMHTLFRSTSGGLDWDFAVQPLVEVSWAWGYMFTGYIAFCCFAVLNVMTGVFCQSAVESAQRDHEMLSQSISADQKRHIKILKDGFQKIDQSGSGVITLKDIEESFQDGQVRMIFSSLDLNPSDAFELFRLIDTQGTGEVNIDEFVDGCMKLRGPARSIQIAGLKHQSAVMKKRLKRMESRLRKISIAAADDASASQARVHSQGPGPRELFLSCPRTLSGISVTVREQAL